MNGSTENIDLYEILSVSKSASKAEIKKAYHKAALAHHPDKVSADEREEAEVKFKSASQAYEILHDDEKREMYDTHGMAAFDGSRGAGGPDLEEMFASMFMGGMGGMPGMGGMGGMGGRGGGRKQKKSPNEQQKYEVTLEDLYKGKTVKFQSTKKILCPTCKGTGGKEKSKPTKCSACKGAGIRQVLRQIGPGTVIQETIECSACEGQGELYNPKDKCKKCKGKRTMESKSQLEIYIPRGAKEGDTIVLEGEADHDPTAEQPGDLIFHLVESQHDVFDRSGSDLAAPLNVTLSEALTGFQRVVVKHLDGRGIEIKHPQTEGQLLRPGQILKVPGEGMPHKRSDAKGDLYLQVRIEFPPDGFLTNPSPSPTPPKAKSTDASKESLSKTAEQLRSLLPGPAPLLKADEVDEVEYEADANMENFGGSGGAGAGAEGWEDDDDEAEGHGHGHGHGAQHAQCAQQ